MSSSKLPIKIVEPRGEGKVIMYLYNNLLHNDYGPAYIMYFGDKIILERYYRNGIPHNDDGPTVHFFNCSFVNDYNHYEYENPEWLAEEEARRIRELQENLERLSKKTSKIGIINEVEEETEEQGLEEKR